MPDEAEGRRDRILTGVVITRRWAVFLISVGVWTWVIWPRFGLAIWDDDRSFANGSPTAFLWVHAVLIVASLALGTVVGVLGVKAAMAARRGTRRLSTRAEEATADHGTAPED